MLCSLSLSYTRLPSCAVLCLVQDAFYEVFGEQPADTTPTVLSPEAVLAAPTWWYRQVGTKAVPAADTDKGKDKGKGNADTSVAAAKANDEVREAQTTS